MRTTNIYAFLTVAMRLALMCFAMMPVVTIASDGGQPHVLVIVAQPPLFHHPVSLLRRVLITVATSLRPLPGYIDDCMNCNLDDLVFVLANRITCA